MWWVKLGDFGITKRIEYEQTALRTRIGTARYLAPEIEDDDFPDSDYTQAVDIWSLGCVIYTILALTPPFMTTASKKKAFPESGLKARSTLDAMDFVRNLLAKDPAERPTAKQARSSKWLLDTVDSLGQNVPAVSSLNLPLLLKAPAELSKAVDASLDRKPLISVHAPLADPHPTSTLTNPNPFSSSRVMTKIKDTSLNATQGNFNVTATQSALSPYSIIATATALFQYTAAGDLVFLPKDSILITEFIDADWARRQNERTGLKVVFPRTYIAVIDEKTAIGRYQPPLPPMPPPPMQSSYGHMPVLSGSSKKAVPSFRVGSHHGGSSGAAKRVMDYFRKRSEDRWTTRNSTASEQQPSHSISPAMPGAVFGIMLDTLWRQDGMVVPYLVYQCVQAVDLFGLEVEGLYRLSKFEHFSKLKSQFDTAMVLHVRGK